MYEEERLETYVGDVVAPPPAGTILCGDLNYRRQLNGPRRTDARGPCTQLQEYSTVQKADQPFSIETSGDTIWRQ